MSMFATIQRPGRPPVVVVLCLVFLFAALVSFVYFGLRIEEVITGRDRSAELWQVCVPVVALVVRCIGMVRLYLMRENCWLWLATAVVIELPATVMSLLRGRLLGHDLTTSVLTGTVHYLIAIGIIYYAFRLFNAPPTGKN